MSTTLSSTDQGLYALTPKYAISTFGIATLGLLSANLVPMMILALGAVGFDLTTAGLLLTISMLCTAFSCMLSSRFTTGALRKPIARIGSLIGGIGFSVVALNPQPWLVVVGLVLGGLGVGAGGAAGGAAVAALKNTERIVGLSTLSNRVLVTIILAVIPFIGIQMLTAFGFLGLLCFIGALVAYWLPVAHAESPAAVGIGAAPISPATRGNLIIGVVLMVSFALWALSEDSFWAMLGTMGTAQAGLNEAQIGLVLSGSTAGGILASLFITAVGDKLGRAAPLIVLILIGSILKFTASQLTDNTGFIVTAIAWNTVYALVFAYVYTVAASLDSSGRWSGPLSGVYLVGSALAPFAASLVTENFGFTVFGYAISALSLLLITPFAVAARYSSRTIQPSKTIEEQS